MFRSLAPLLALATFSCAQRPIGTLSARDLAMTSRPNEARAAIDPEDRDPKLLKLQEGMLLHQAGRWDESSLAWSHLNGEYPMHAPEKAMLDRLAALNLLATSQQESLLQQVVPAVAAGLRPVPSDRASVVVLIERGWAPRLTTYSNPSDSKAEIVTILEQPAPLAPVLVRLDAEKPVEAQAGLDASAAWGDATLSRALRQEESLKGSIAGVFQLWKTRDLWWSAPTALAVALLETDPGRHVLMVPRARGYEERLVTLGPGQRLFVVDRQ